MFKRLGLSIFCGVVLLSGAASAQGVGRYAKGPSASDLADLDSLIRWCRGAVIDKYGAATNPQRPNVKYLNTNTAIGYYGRCQHSKGRDF